MYVLKVHRNIFFCRGSQLAFLMFVLGSFILQQSPLGYRKYFGRKIIYFGNLLHRTKSDVSYLVFCYYVNHALETHSMQRDDAVRTKGLQDIKRLDCRSRSGDSSFGIATGYGLDGREVSLRDPIKNFLFSTWSRPALGPIQARIQCILGTLSPGVMRPGREADYSPPASSKVKKTWIYTSTPHTPSWRSV
jgi:hypothetical protein